MYDLIILGGGPGGFNAAMKAAKAGLNTLMIEESDIGGVCLNEGCIPSKTFLNTAKIVAHANESRDFGFECEGAKVDQPKLLRRKNKVVKKLVGGLKMSITNSGAEILNAKAELLEKVGDGENVHFVVKAGDEKLEAKNVIVATGSSPIIIPFEGLEEAQEKGLVLTNKGILDLKEVPERLSIIGGGVIGLEMACHYAIAGSKVSVIEMLDHIAGNTEREIAQILQKNLEKLGVEFNLGCKVTAVKAVSSDENHVAEITYENPEGGETKLEADKVLLSIGRRANTAGIGLENLSVELEKGAIKVDDRQESSVKGLFAVGDVTGGIMLAHTAYREAEIAVNNILGDDDRRDDSAVPSVIYTMPEVACCGLTAEECNDLGIEYQEIKRPLSYSGRYQAETERGDGLLKLVVGDDRILGCHVVGNYASEYIVVAGIFIASKMSLKEIKKFVFPHPTVCEIIREAVFEVN